LALLRTTAVDAVNMVTLLRVQNSMRIGAEL
jgi:hypothetical protein